MFFVEHDHVVETLSPYGADDAFAVGILPWRAGCDQDFFDPHAVDPFREVIAVDAVAIADEKTRGFFVWKGVDDLLGGPYGVGIGGHIEVNHLSPIVTEHDENVQDAESDGRNGEEIAGRNIGHVVVQERSPGLRRWLLGADHVLGHGRFGNVVAQQSQFGYDPWCAPHRVLSGHAANQIPDFAFDTRATGFPCPRLPSPIQLEAHSMPSDDRFGLDDGQCGTPVRSKPGEPHPEDASAEPQLRTFDGLFADRQLLSQGQILGGEAEPGHQERSDQKIDRLDDAHVEVSEVVWTRQFYTREAWAANPITP